MELKRVVVTGLGALTPLGNDVSQTWKGLVDGVSGAGPITHFDASNFKTHFACELKDFDVTRYIDRKEARKMDPYAQYALIASEEGVKDSGLDSGLSPADESMSSGQDTYMTFDITEIYHTWFDDPANRNGLMMRVEVEGPTETLDDVMWADTLARGTDPTVPPRLEVSWYGDLAETDPGQMDIEDFTIEVGPGVTETENGSNTTAGVVAYGQSQAESTISYTLKRVSGGTVTSDETTAESEWLYPDYTLVEDTCVDAILKNANWQSEASMYDDDLRLNTIYQYKVQATDLISSSKSALAMTSGLVRTLVEKNTMPPS